MARLKAAPAQLQVAGARLAAPRKVADPFYRGAEWRALVAAIKRQRGNRCEACGRGHRVIIGDHIRELKDGGAALDAANVRLLCLPCHNAKTAAARAARAKG